ncbi:hypothetical protein QAD02_000684 [Eretmocerus hayati]|uniref:Uncharacterized protein n=1 Tax=Eretmocerus hayati TaxID=131215 RepID=A0ACC2NE35_9HYME|nr:hypothetical protein QAD02_000684 [Eretmocerus hayati]
MTNNCYKKYTDKNKVSRVQNQEKSEVSFANSVSDVPKNLGPRKTSTEEKVTRSKLNSSSATTKNQKICVICGVSYHTKDQRRLYRISEQERAQRFLDLRELRQDKVFVRTSHIYDVDGVFAADIYYHRHCMRAYEMQLDENGDSIGNHEVPAPQTEIAGQSEEVPPLVAEEAMAHVIDGIVPKFRAGYIFTLSEVRDQVNRILPPDDGIRNRHIKKYLIEEFGEDVEFSTPSNKNKSSLFYSSEISLDKVVERLQPENILKESGLLIREYLRGVQFDLHDRFNDAADLQYSFENTAIPDEMMIFFSAVFHLSENVLRDDKISRNEKKPFDSKILKIKSLFQIMVFILSNGQERTPFQVMNGISIHATCKSFPLPSRLVKSLFTVLAFDNFDWIEWILSGLKSIHDTVIVAFQEASGEIQRKPCVSATSINKRSRSFDTKLPSQELKTFHKPPGKVTLPPDTKIDPPIQPEMFARINSDDFTWNLSRTLIDDDGAGQSERENESETVQTVSSWSAYNAVTCDDHQKIQNTASLPILPFPVTEYSTVYTAMCNFIEILNQLDQKHLPIVCDEGVYRIARHIQLLHPEKFGGMIFMLGSLHMAKILESCIGKYLSESGADHVLVETESFGVNVVEQVLAGSNYARSMKGFDILAEALQRLQIEAFLKECGPNKYGDELSTIKALQEAFSENNPSECKSLHKIFVNNAERLIQDFQEFVSKRREISPSFKYWDNFLSLHRLLKNFTRADREANWDLHEECVKLCLPILLIFDRTNYSRWLPLYYHDISTLKDYAPEVYEKFKQGKFVNKRTSINFTSVGYDHGLESSINLAQKSKSGTLGCTQNENYVTSWNLSYHEVLAICNYYRNLTNTKSENDGLRVHHESSPMITDRIERQVTNIMKYIGSRGSNPFQDGTDPLINLATKEIATAEAIKSLLNIFDDACEVWQEFCQKRFVNKSVSISDTISRFNLPNFKTPAKGDSNRQRKSKCLKEVKAAHEFSEIAKERKYDLHKLFSFKLTKEDILFNIDGTMKRNKSKSDLVKELERKFEMQIIQDIPDLIESTIIIDVMLQCRQMKWKEMRTFGDFAAAFCQRVSNLSNRGAIRIDLIFDSYSANSVKSGERSDRYKNHAIDIQMIDGWVPCPKQEKLFWGSNENKTKLQEFLRDYCLRKAQEIWPRIEIICSGTTDLPCQSSKQSDLDILQNDHIEKADSRIILHVFHACSEGTEKILVKSSDTDIVVLLLHYWRTFGEKGLKELWMLIGAASKKRYLPLHDLAKKCGPICSVLIPLHHLTGADYTSEVGTKRAGLEAGPETHLTSFAQGIYMH